MARLLSGLSARSSPRHVRLPSMLEPVTVPCQECGVDLAGDSADLRLELTVEDEPVVYCAECWEREFGAD